MATLKEIWTKIKEGAEYTEEAFLSDAKGVVNEAVKSKAEAFENVLSDHGFKKPDGATGHSFLGETIAAIKGERDKLTAQTAELNAQIEKITKAAPKADEIRAEFETQLATKTAEIETLNNTIRTNQQKAALSQITSSFKYDEAVSEKAKGLERLAFHDISTNFEVKEVEGIQTLYKNGVQHRDQAGAIVTVEGYLKTELSPFFKKDADPNPPQNQPTGGGTGFKTSSEVMEYAKANNIDPLSAEGQELLMQQVGTAE